MKGVLLAGGSGSRLYPATKVTNKHLVPVYHKPMIYYPLDTLKKMGIREIMIVSGKEHAGHIMNLLGSGAEDGVKLTYRVQDSAGGIAQALLLAEDFSNGQPVVVILGDNVFEDVFEVSDFKKGSKIFLKQVPDAKRFGVAEIQGDKVIGIEEKPRVPKTDFAVTGIYVYDSKVFEFIKELRPSARGELEITDVNNRYIALNEMQYQIVKGFWSDAGTFESLFKASEFVKNKGQYLI